MRKILLYMPYLFMLIRGIILAFISLKFVPFFIGRNVRTNLMFGINYGLFLRVGSGVKLNGLGGKGVRLGNRVKIGDYSIVEVVMGRLESDGSIDIGDGTCIGEYSYLGGAGGLKIGKNTITGQYFSCHPENHIWTIEGIGKYNGVTREGISVGDNCWIGSKVTILDGSKLGNNLVVAAGSVVKGVFPDNVLIAGVPAKIIKEIK